MKIRKPDYYDRFQCIAGACSDSCCIGWEIDVDGERQDTYRSVKGEIGERLKQCIDWEEGHFILQGKEERCPFLNKDNLCDLIIELGEDSLCDICREHPRYYEWYDDMIETGVGLCCEAAAKLVLESPEKADFCMCEEPNETSEGLESDDPEVIEVLIKARETAYAILQDRSQSIWKRLKIFLAYIGELQDALDFEDLDEIEESAEYYLNAIWEGDESEPECVDAYTTILDFCEKLDPIDESWPTRLNGLRKQVNDVNKFAEAEQTMLNASVDRSYEYEHMAVYFVYRYFMKCRTDCDVYSRGCLAVFFVLLVRMLDTATYMETGKLSKEDRVMHAKDCSKEIEYSEENLALLADLFWKEGFDKISECL